jgi:hypothetical protein
MNIVVYEEYYLLGYNAVQSVEIQKIEPFITTAARASNPTLFIITVL